MKKRLFALLLILVLCSGLLTACGASSKYEMASGATMDAAAPEEGMVESTATSTAMDMGFSTSQADSADFSAIRENAKLILRANVEGEAIDFELVQTAIPQLTAEAGGYIESNTTSGQIGYRWAEYVLRVPQEKFESFLNQIGKACHVTYTSTSSTDITDQYYDTEARLATQTTKQTRLLALLEKAENMEDIIALENALAEVNYEIETLTGTKREYDNLVGFSTIILHINEVRDLTALQETPSFLSELKKAFVSGGRSFTLFCQDVLIGLASSWPFLLLLGILLILVWVFYRKLPKFRFSFRRKKTKDEDEKDS